MSIKKSIKWTRFDYQFNLIEEEQNDKIKEFFEDYPEYINNIISQHEWTPVMYACRYGNYEQLKMFKEIGFNIDTNNVLSLQHLTCFSENMDIIKYLVSTVKQNGEGITSLLRISTVQNKRDIALYFFQNGGYIINDTDPRNEFYYNV